MLADLFWAHAQPTPSRAIKANTGRLSLLYPPLALLMIRAR